VFQCLPCVSVAEMFFRIKASRSNALMAAPVFYRLPTITANDSASAYRARRASERLAQRRIGVSTRFKMGIEPIAFIRPDQQLASHSSAEPLSSACRQPGPRAAPIASVDAPT